MDGPLACSGPTLVIHLLEGLALVVVTAVCLSLLAAQAVTGVPTMSAGPAEKADVVALLRRAGCPDGAVIYDLGCGWGALVLALAEAFPNAQIRGVELSPVPYWVARLRTRHLRNVSLQRRDFLRLELDDAWAVACYLMPKPMPKLAAHLDRTLKPGAPVVALSFWFRDRQAAAVREGPGLRGAAALYYWPARRVAA
jgi:cyclopropane fatty-acyl-phospholipid synthase-like methyltransferase